MSPSASPIEVPPVGPATSSRAVDTQAPPAAPPAASTARELELEQRVQQLEKANAELQSQLTAQKSTAAPKDYKAVPLASRPFAEPFIWPTFPIRPTLDDFNYAKRVHNWLNDLEDHFDAETGEMEKQVGECRMCDLAHKALWAASEQLRQHGISRRQ